MPFVAAYSTVTGVKQRIPAHWLDHPRFGRQFRKTPLHRANEASSPFDTKTVDELKEYAAEHAVDVTGLTRKSDLIEAITTPTEPDSGQTEGEARA